jgi:hypothetical protein
VFVSSKHLQPGPIFASTPMPNQLVIHSGSLLLGRLQASLINIRQGWKELQWANALAYFSLLSVIRKITFKTLAPGSNVIKLFLKKNNLTIF